MNITTINFIGTISALCTTMAILPQTIKTIRTRQTKNLSVITYSMTVFGVLMWIFYAFLINNKILIISNLISFSFSFPILVIAIFNIKNKTNN